MSEFDQPSVEKLSMKNNDISTGNNYNTSVKETILNKYKGETLGGKYHGKGTNKFIAKKRFPMIFECYSIGAELISPGVFI